MLLWWSMAAILTVLLYGLWDVDTPPTTHTAVGQISSSLLTTHCPHTMAKQDSEHRCSWEVQNNRHWSFLTSRAPTMDRTCSANARRPHTQSSFFGELAIGKRSVGAPRKRYTKTQSSLHWKLFKSTRRYSENWQPIEVDGGAPSDLIGCQRFEEERIHVAREQRRTRKERERHQQHSPPPDTAAVFPCDQCGRSCLSKIGLFSQTRWHTTHAEETIMRTDPSFRRPNRRQRRRRRVPTGAIRRAKFQSNRHHKQTNT